MYKIYRKNPDSFQGDFEFLSKSGTFFTNFYLFLPILWLISWSLPDDEGGITCMPFMLLESNLPGPGG